MLENIAKMVLCKQTQWHATNLWRGVCDQDCEDTCASCSHRTLPSVYTILNQDIVSPVVCIMAVLRHGLVVSHSFGFELKALVALPPLKWQYM